MNYLIFAQKKRKMSGNRTFTMIKPDAMSNGHAGKIIDHILSAGFFGFLIPYGLNYFRVDPAIASSVFVTTITDVVGFLSFLGLASIFLF